MLRQHEIGTNHPEKFRGWYNLAGGGAGFLLIETDHIHELSEILQPYMDLMGWDVHGIYPLVYDEMIRSLRSPVEEQLAIPQVSYSSGPP